MGGKVSHTVLRGDPINQISEWLSLCIQIKGSEVLLPARDQEEEGEDDEEGKATNGCCDDDQHLALVRSDVWCWVGSGGCVRKKGKDVGLSREDEGKEGPEGCRKMENRRKVWAGKDDKSSEERKEGNGIDGREDKVKKKEQIFIHHHLKYSSRSMHHTYMLSW